MLRVGLNATGFNDRPSGAKQRFVGIYGALVRQRPDWTFVVYEPADCRVARWFEGAPNVIARRTPIASSGRLQRVVGNVRYWRPALSADRIDVFENFVLPLVVHGAGRTVLTIHDIRSLYEVRNPASASIYRRVFRRAFSRSDRIIAVSDAMRAEILAFHPSAAVSTVHNGVEAAHFRASHDGEVTEVRARHGLPERFILTVGHLEKRKNLPVLIEAIGRLRDAGQRRPLVIVGNDGGMRAALFEQIAALDLGDRVTVIEGADDAALRALYAGCDLLAFPSRYEGFGIPILEAMAAGKPMVLADTPVFRELTSDRGLYFPVDDPAGAAAAIDLVWSDARERRRQLDFGGERIRDFGFDRLATRISEVYRSL